MDAERRSEVKHVVDETQNFLAQVNLQLNGDHPKYEDSHAWEQAAGAIADKITDILTEEQNALQTRSDDEAKFTETDAALEATVVYLEEALNCANGAADAVSNSDFEEARKKLEEQVHKLEKSMG